MMKRKNIKSELEENAKSFKLLYSSLRLSSHRNQNIEPNRQKLKHTSSSANNDQLNISPIAQRMQSLGFDIYKDKEKMKSLNSKSITLNQKNSQIKKISISNNNTITQRKKELDHQKKTTGIKRINMSGNNKNELNQHTLALSSIEISNKKDNTLALYSKQLKVSNKLLKIFLSKNVDEREVRNNQSIFVSHYCSTTKDKNKKNHTVSLILDKDKKTTPKYSMNKLSMVITRVKEYTKLQLGLSNLQTDLLKKEAKTYRNKMKGKSKSHNEAKKQISSNLYSQKINNQMPKNKLLSKVNSAPKIVLRNNKKKELLHWTHSVVNPPLSSCNNDITNCDLLYKININETSSWKKEIENIITVRSLTDREIIQYYIQ